jgi:hypothetical protein
MTFDAEKLYSLLPAIHRLRDARGAAPEEGEPLRALLSVIADQAVILEDDLEQLYDDLFIETCAPWVAPYIGDLIGLNGVQGPGQPGFTPRAEVANTIGYRRRKGTAAMLEQLARDVTGWPARAVEFFQLLASTQYLNHVRLENRSFVSVYQANRLEWLGSAFEHLPATADLPHTVDVRRIARGRGRYNIPNIGITLWRLRAYALTRSPAAADPSDPKRHFRFDPLGRDMPLFSLPQTEDEVTSLASPLNVPQPISRRAMDADVSAYYRSDASLLIALCGTDLAVEPEPISVERICVCDLSDWKHTPPVGKTAAIDPMLGRIVFADAQKERVLVSFHYGFSADMGGGEYGRVGSFIAPRRATDPRVANVFVPQGVTPAPKESIQVAIDNLPAEGGVVEIIDSGSYSEKLKITATGRHVELRAADGHRPTLLLGGELQISGDGNGEVTLNGLLIAGTALAQGAGLTVTGGLGRLRLRHCTLLPGAATSLTVNSVGTQVEIDHCIIVGALSVSEDAAARIAQSIVDVTRVAGVVYSAKAGVTDAGGPLQIENSTVIGEVYTRQLTLASNTLFMSPVRVEQRQEGCVRFCYLAPGSVTPRRHRCQPATSGDAVRVRPVFTSDRYGDAAYGQLSGRCAVEIRHGADDEAEMGAFHDLFQPQREAYLRARLDDYLRFGLEAGLLFAS